MNSLGHAQLAGALHQRNFVLRDPAPSGQDMDIKRPS